MIKGIIFDFNGTLFWDSPLHEKAWSKFTSVNNLRMPSEEEVRAHILGKGADDIISYVFGQQKSPEDVYRYTQEKEAIYRDLVMSDPESALAPGVVVLLDHLKSIDFPMTIATSSEEVNVDFFFKFFALDTWFDRKKVIFDDSSFDLKPAPDIFLFAAEALEISILDCLIIEDSISGLQAAKDSGAKTVVYVDNNSPMDYDAIKHLVDVSIHRLDEVMPLIQE